MRIPKSRPAPVRPMPLRDYQQAIFTDHQTGIVILHWSRQIGKSYTLAAWAVDRLLTQLHRYESWLITVLSNSRDNGAEFQLKCAEVCRRFGATFVSQDESPDLDYKNMRMECRVTFRKEDGVPRTGRIKILAANPRTARGFSGDLILDEFAFHEDSNAIWEAAEPILSANPEFLCRIASTGNGRHNLFYRMAAAPMPFPVAAEVTRLHNSNHPSPPTPLNRDEFSNRANALPLPGLSHHSEAKAEGAGRGLSRHLVRHSLDDGGSVLATADEGNFFSNRSEQAESATPNTANSKTCNLEPATCNSPSLFISQSGFPVSRITRTTAHALGVPIYDPHTRAPITPAAARAKARDKRAYDQNYECAFNDEAMALLTHAMIAAAERSPIAIDEQSWSAATLERLARATGELFIGNDIGRHRDLSVVTVLEKASPVHRVIGMLRMNGLRLPAQKIELEKVCRLPNFRAFAGDMTGIGLGLIEFLQEDFGVYRIHGVNFSSSEPLSNRLRNEGRQGETARVTEIMATDLLECFEDRTLEIPSDPHLREDLAKPEKITSPGGRVSIAATRDEAGHADHFWSLALAVRATRSQPPAGRFLPPSGWRAIGLANRRDRSVLC